MKSYQTPERGQRMINLDMQGWIPNRVWVVVLTQETHSTISLEICLEISLALEEVSGLTYREAQT